MGILSSDTSPEIEKLQFRILREKGPVGRLSLLQDQTLTTWALLLAGGRENALLRWWGRPFPVRIEGGTNFMRPLQTPLLVAGILDRLNLRYVIGGSYASALHGEPRSTRDCDFLVEFGEADIGPLQSAVEGEFYISPVAAREAVELKKSFNLIHLETGFKIDIFVSPDREYDRERLGRGQVIEFEGRNLSFSTAEDTILSKLEWHSLHPSDQQWRDILAVILLQQGRLDEGYLRYWARELDLEEALEKAFQAT